nr:uncharacterized protein LOC127347533 [Lolium perenne]
MDFVSLRILGPPVVKNRRTARAVLAARHCRPCFGGTAVPAGTAGASSAALPLAFIFRLTALPRLDPHRARAKLPTARPPRCSSLAQCCIDPAYSRRAPPSPRSRRDHAWPPLLAGRPPPSAPRTPFRCRRAHPKLTREPPPSRRRSATTSAHRRHARVAPLQPRPRAAPRNHHQHPPAPADPPPSPGQSAHSAAAHPAPPIQRRRHASAAEPPSIPARSAHLRPGHHRQAAPAPTSRLCLPTATRVGQTPEIHKKSPASLSHPRKIRIDRQCRPHHTGSAGHTTPAVPPNTHRQCRP